MNPIKTQPAGRPRHGEIKKHEATLDLLNPRLAGRMLFDLLLIHEFETSLLRLKNEGCVWGPVHSSVGQEAVAVGAIHGLIRGDKALSTHRSHHHFLAKILQHVLPDAWDAAADPLPEDADRAVRRTLAEIMGLAPGWCGGRGGSMHLRWAEAGFLGSNAIVGGGIPPATGVAFAEMRRASGRIVICFFGDGACNQGAFHEACNMAGLWRLPIIFFLENNYYAVATGIDQSCAVADLSVRAGAYGMPGLVVDGDDPLAVYDCVREAAARVREGHGPCLIEARCWRHFHHAGDQPGSSFGYRGKELEEQWRRRDAVANFPQRLAQAGILTEGDIAAIGQKVRKTVARAVDFCTVPGPPVAVRTELWPDPKTAGEGMRGDGAEWQAIEFCEPEAMTLDGEMRYSDAIAAVTGRWLEKDERVFVLGEEVANFGGGAYGATKGLPARFPGRVLNTPISEAGFVGLGLGAAMADLRPVIEIMFPDFSLVAADQLFNQIGKARHMFGNTTDLPLVVRTRVAIGCGYGGQHSMDPIGLYALFPGWRIVVPGNAADYIGLFNAAMHSLDPVLIIEHNTLYTVKFPVPENNLDYVIPFGRARVRKPGTDVTVIAYGAMAERCERLHARWAERGVSAEIIDLRTVDALGIDYEAIGRSLARTQSAVIVEEAPASLSIGHRLAAGIMERFFDDLDGPVACLASQDVPPSVSRVLEEAVILSDAEILETTESVARRRWR